MDISFLNEFMVPIVAGICLCVGYVLKNIVPTEKINRFIPLIMGVLGVALNGWIQGTFSAEILLGGLFSGLSSTGLHQIFKQMMEQPSN
ncbi:MAG: phage holin family protein [Roseburia sp.]|nr:phage holin family protein [Roseburia sp.]